MFSAKRERLLLIVLVVAGLVLTGLFGVRLVRSYLRIQQVGLQPGTTDVEAIRGWMTVPYIAAIYQVPEEVIYQRLGVPAEGNADKSLSALNRELAPGQQRFALELVKDVVRKYQVEHPPADNADE